jgi:hypothetical protein
MHLSITKIEPSFLFQFQFTNQTSAYVHNADLKRPYYLGRPH